MRELEEYICGKRLGVGAYRSVYAFAPDSNFVVKVANENGRAVNLLEEKIWHDIWSTPLEKWFAPVKSVSEAGKYLIQERVEMMPKDKYPLMIPHFFTDTKYSNFGWLKGKFVCCDFGSFNMFRGVSPKMVKAKWWE